MKAILILILGLTACARPESSQNSPNSQPVSQPQSKSEILCGDMLLSTDGYVFLINQQTLDATVLSNGTYGYDAYTNGWGQVPACHYQVLNGSVEPL